MNNPPAFPLHNHGAQTLGMHVTGMTLRDYMAAKAMQSIVSVLHQGIRPADISGMCCDAYAIADEMLKARET